MITYETSIAEPVEEHAEDYSFANCKVGVAGVFVACPKHDTAWYHEAICDEQQRSTTKLVHDRGGSDG